MDDKKKKLFVPGPVDVRPELLEAFNQPLIPHRSQDASDLQKRISDKLQDVFLADNNQIFLSTSSGIGLMEAAIRCLTDKKAVVFSVGAFGDRWGNIAEFNDVPVDVVEIEWGKAVKPEMVEEYLSTGDYDVFTVQHNETSTGIANPLEEISEISNKYPDVLWLVDAVSAAAGIKAEVANWGIDAYVTSTQKALGLPPGFSMGAFSDKAMERAEEIGHQGRYFDLLTLKKYYDKKPYQYPSTPSILHMYALDKQLDYILDEEGLENRFERHKRLRDMTHEWALDNGFELFAEEGYRSPTVTTVTNNKGLDILEL